jgi:hypothetical protein
MLISALQWKSSRNVVFGSSLLPLLFGLAVSQNTAPPPQAQEVGTIDEQGIPNVESVDRLNPFEATVTSVSTESTPDAFTPLEPPLAPIEQLGTQDPVTPIEPLGTQDPLIDAGVDLPDPSVRALPVKTCTGTIARKEVRDTTTAEWDQYVAAFKVMNGNGELARFVGYHQRAWSLYHQNEKFLPFHRIYLLEFERLLMSHGAPFLPYWDSTWESQNPAQSPVLQERYMGANDGEFIINGPFARGEYTVTVGGGPLIRQYSPETDEVLYARVLIEDDVMIKPQFSTFSELLENGPHASVHSIIGGSSGQMSKSTSPEDPIFWVHHAFVDKLWYEHQVRYGIQYDGIAFQELEADDTEDLGFDGWAMQVRAVLDINDICIAYVEPNPANMGVSIVNETIKAPEIAENWLNNSGANPETVKELLNETRRSATFENKNRSTSAAASLLVSALLASVSLMFALI